MKQSAGLATLLALTITQSACIVVGGYSNRGGWFLWPGGLGFFVVVLVLYFLLRRR